jgi:hypothetical protein
MHYTILVLSALLGFSSFAADPSRRGFLQGVASGATAAVVPKMPASPTTITPEIENAFRISRQLSAVLDFGDHVNYTPGHPVSMWAHVFDPSVNPSSSENPSLIYERVADMELQLAKEMGVSPNQIFQASRVILDERYFINAIFSGLADDETVVPSFVDDSFVEKYSSRLRSVVPFLGDKLYLDRDYSGGYWLITLRNSLLSRFRFSEMGDRQLLKFTLMRERIPDNLQEALPKLSQIYLQVIQEYERARQRLSKLKSPRLQNHLSPMITQISTEMEVELEALPFRYQDYLDRKAAFAPNTIPTPLPEEVTKWLENPRDWIQYLGQASRALGFANSFAVQLEVKQEPASLEAPCLTALEKVPLLEESSDRK